MFSCRGERSNPAFPLSASTNTASGAAAYRSAPTSMPHIHASSPPFSARWTATWLPVDVSRLRMFWGVLRHHGIIMVGATPNYGCLAHPYYVATPLAADIYRYPPFSPSCSAHSSVFLVPATPNAVIVYMLCGHVATPFFLCRRSPSSVYLSKPFFCGHASRRS